MEIPGPDAGVILHIPETEVPHALSQTVNVQAVEGIAVISGFHERYGVFFHFLFQFREVPLFIIGIGHAHYIMDILPVLDGRCHIPKAAFIERQAAEGSIPTLICNEQLILCARHFMAREEAPVVDQDEACRAFFCFIDVYLICIFLPIL